jgi:YidC/Oxa1 family membrane protein insertase
MEKRVFLAIFLSFGILVLYQTYVVPPPPPPTSVPVMGSEGAAATSTAPASATPGPAALSEPTAATDVPATPQDTTPAREIVVDTDHVRVVFTTEGAAVTSWRLKRYFDSRGEPLELVPAQLPAGSARPFTLATDQDALSARLASVKFSSATEGTLSLGSAPGTLSFEFADPSTGLIARKSFHFQPDGLPYNVTIDASVDVRGVARPVTLKMGPSLGLGFGLGSSMMPSYPPAPSIIATTAWNGSRC